VQRRPSRENPGQIVLVVLHQGESGKTQHNLENRGKGRSGIGDRETGDAGLIVRQHIGVAAEDR